MTQWYPMSHDDALRMLRRSQDRSFGSEGIPMVLALVSEIGPVPAAVEPAVLEQGRRVATELDAYRAALVPSSRDDDLGCLISVLQAVSYQDLAGAAQPTDDVDGGARRVGQ